MDGWMERGREAGREREDAAAGVLCLSMQRSGLTFSFLSSVSSQTDPSGVGSDRGVVLACRGCLACRDPLDRLVVSDVAAAPLRDGMLFCPAVGWGGAAGGNRSS